MIDVSSAELGTSMFPPDAPVVPTLNTFGSGLATCVGAE